MNQPRDKVINNSHAKYLRVVKQNALCSIQDLGRVSSQHLGFSGSGASDEYAFLYANYLLESITHTKNPTQPKNCLNAQLEITLGQVTFQASHKCTIAITGAECNVHINNTPIKNWQVHQVNTNDRITFNQPNTGLHSYLAVLGGIQSQLWLNSRSQTSTENHLGFNSQAITPGTSIPLSNDCFSSEFHSEKLMTKTGKPQLTPSSFYQELTSTLVLRFIPQPLWLSLNLKSQAALINHQFTIAAESNRMGYRLSEIPANINIDPQQTKLSKPVTYGTIQLPNNNQPIILMKERQTIGGYPVLGSVMQTDLFRLSQLRPGNKVQLLPTSLSFAQQQLAALSDKFSFYSPALL